MLCIASIAANSCLRLCKFCTSTRSPFDANSRSKMAQMAVLEQELEQILDGADGKDGELGEEADPAGAAEPAAEPPESISGSSTRGFDPTVDAGYVRKLIILIVRTCNLCAHQSNEVNPLVHGYYARNTVSQRGRGTRAHTASQRGGCEPSAT